MLLDAVRPPAVDPTATTGPRVLVVTGADTNQMGLLRQMLATLQATAAGADLPVACYDLGLTDADRAWLAAQRIELVKPWHRFEVPGGPWPAWLDAYLAQPFLPEQVPGWDVYLWIDADIWFQDDRAVRAYIDGAMSHGFAIAHERTPMYRSQAWLTAWMGKHFVKGFGAVQGLWLLTRPHLNSGFYAMRGDAPHWSAWAERYRAAIRRASGPTPYGQFAINQIVYGPPFGSGLRTAILEPWANWIVDRGPPMWDDTRGVFCEPAAPHRPLSVLHLAGPGKKASYAVRRTGGGSFESRIVPGASPQQPMRG